MRRGIITTLAVASSVAVIGLVGGCGSDSTSSGGASTAAGDTPASGIDAKALFINGDPSTGALGCGGCHTLAAAGTTGQVGPNLDEIAPDDKTAALAEMIVKPNAEIVTGYQADVMPKDYAKTLTPAQVTALAAYINTVSKHAEK